MYKLLQFEDGETGYIQCDEVTEEGAGLAILGGLIAVDIISRSVINAIDKHKKEKLDKIIESLQSQDKDRIKSFFNNLSKSMSTAKNAIKSKITPIVARESKALNIEVRDFKVEIGDFDLIPEDDRDVNKFYKQVKNLFSANERSILNPEIFVDFSFLIKGYYEEDEYDLDKDEFVENPISDNYSTMCQKTFPIINKIDSLYKDSILTINMGKDGIDEFESYPVGNGSDCRKFWGFHPAVEVNEKVFRETFQPLINALNKK